MRSPDESFALPPADSGPERAEAQYPYIYSWGPRIKGWNLPEFPQLDRKGERCRVLARGTMNSALVEFEEGELAVISRNALRTVSTP